MALIRTAHNLESVQFTFDGAGNVAAVHLNRTFAIADDATLNAQGQPLPIVSGVRDAPDVWPLLTPTQRTAANSIAKRLIALSATL